MTARGLFGALLCVPVLLSAAAPLGARAQHALGPQQITQALPGPRLMGEITALSGPVSNPDGFTLDTGNRSMDVHIAPKATFTARSAEAEVEGLQVGDYAVANVVRQNRQWIATRIVFDVQPFGPITIFTVSGVVTRVSLDARHIFVKPDNGAAKEIAIRPTTKFRMDGQAVSAPLALTKGDQVQILVRRAPAALVALDVNLKTSSSGSSP